MLTISEVLSNETREKFTTPDGKHWPSGYGLLFYALDAEGRPWRLTVFLSDMFGFSGIRVDRTDVPEYRESDYDDDEEEDAAYASRVAVDPSEALSRVRAEFERASEAPWTRVYTTHWQALAETYERFRSTISGERRIEPYR